MRSPIIPRPSRTGLRWLAVGFCIALPAAAAQALAQDTPPNMTDPITAKTYLEIAKLEWETGPGRYVSIATPLLVVLVGAGLAAWFDRRLKAAELRFTELTSARKDAYAEAFGHLKPTALYFPPAARAETGNQATTGRHILTPGDCEKMGAALSDWYFGEGGVLMSRRARDAYFALAHALARASVAKALHSPQVSDAKFMVDIPDLAVRQKALGIDIPAMLGSGATATPSKSPGSRGSGAAVGDWKFNSGTETDPWRDFILIQSLASAFRTRLTDDIESRIPPKDPGD